MASIFENAYYGKPYKTRDKKKVLFIKETDNDCFWLVDEDCNKRCVHKNGCYHDLECFIDPENYLLPTDIISEWQEEIDEEKVYDNAKVAFKHSAFKSDDAWGEAVYCTGYHEGWCDAIKTIQGGNDV